MNKTITSGVVACCALVLVGAVISGTRGQPAAAPAPAGRVAAEQLEVRTFGTAGKQLTPLSADREAELFTHEGGPGCLTHMWFGGAFKDYEKTRIRVYVDGEAKASIDMELGLGHGIGFADPAAPWGVARMGKTGNPSGIYNTYRVPFTRSIRVTGQLAAQTPGRPDFWWIIRGSGGLRATLGALELPVDARLRLYTREDYVAKPMEEFPLCDVGGDGALYQVTLAARGLRTGDDPSKRWMDLSYMEGCMRAYIGPGAKPLLLSSGLEDYFLGTYYFNLGRYYTPVAGLTHLDVAKNEFSAYRFHEDDPVFFKGGLKLTARCGDSAGGDLRPGARPIGDPPQTQYTSYVWVYQW